MTYKQLIGALFEDYVIMESVHYVKEQLGHASIQTTVDVYGHIVPGSNRNAVNRLDDEGLGGLQIVSSA